MPDAELEGSNGKAAFAPDVKVSDLPTPQTPMSLHYTDPANPTMLIPSPKSPTD